MEIVLDFLGADNFMQKQNAMMHALDVFEQGKFLAEYEELIINGDESVNLPVLCKHVAEAYEKDGGYALFVAIRRVGDKRVSEPYMWFKEGVQSISMKQKDEELKWGLFKDILAQLGYIAETDGRMHVIGVK